MNFRTINLRKDPDCPLCASNGSIRSIDAARYDFSCAPEASEPNSHDNTRPPIEVSVGEAAALTGSGNAVILDVREPYELNVCRLSVCDHIPMAQIPGRLDSISTNKHVLVLCHHGRRSLNVTHFLRAQGLTNVSSVRGGIDAWAREIDCGMNRY